ncbi:MAG: triose-phosphate isomerase [Pseudomonadales bacterium]|nr:triose-phosphate isomerase [Pseudomonadales bacterium]
MRQSIIVANWKMNGTRDSVNRLSGVLAKADYDCLSVLCSPAVFLESVGHVLANCSIKLGAQNLDWREAGAYTGEVSAEMLREYGCEYAIVGHSERRSLYAETDAQVALKFAACLRAGITPILCVGESLEQRQAGATEGVVESQILAVLEKNGIDSFAHAIIAYEPIWAIGTGETATPEQAEAVHKKLRDILCGFDENISELIKIIYGGSVNEKNSAELFSQKNIDGALVGGASLDADAFLAICASTQKKYQ